MLFSSLAKLLTDKYPVSICEVPLDCEVVDVVLYEETKPLPSVDCLCVFTAKQMSDAESLPLNIVCVGEIDTTTYGRAKNNNSNFILIPDASSADAVCYILSIFGNTLKQQKLYSDLIYMLLSDEDLASIFCTFAKETDCQMLAIDITGKVLAYSKPFRVNHPHWLHSVEVGYLDKYLIEYILSYRVKHNMSISPQPFVLFCDRLQLFIKTIRVIYNGEIIAYAFMGNYTGEFPEFSDRFMSLIAKRMLNTLLGSRSYSTYRFNMHQNILADIIKGASEEEAVQMVKDLLEKLQPGNNLTVKEINPTYNGSKMDELENSLDSQIESYIGYQMRFVREVNGMQENTTMYSGTDDEEIEATYIPFGYERVEVYVGDEGITSFSWSDRMQEGEILQENVEMISFEKVQSIIEEQIMMKDADMEDIEVRQKVVSVDLGLMCVRKPNDNSSFTMVPVWDVYEIWEEANIESDLWADTELTINAIDGSIINRGYRY